MDKWLDRLLMKMAQLGASDLHLFAGKVPMVRVDGALKDLEGENPATVQDMISTMKDFLTPEQQAHFTQKRDLDLAITSNNIRYRANFFKVRGENPAGVPAAVFRRIETNIPTMQSLGLPPMLAKLAELPRGLILVTGPAGSGKSTSLAAMIRHLNDSQALNIITVEDPVEYLHPSNRSLIRQREVGPDTESFSNALRAAMRQDPNVILVGEMRDTATMELAITAAETGHLVLATLHTRTAPAAVDRVIDAFEAGKQNQIRTQLANSLEAVISQVLVPRSSGEGRVAALEIMLGTYPVRNLIREAKTHQLGNMISMGMKDGMVSLETSLAHLARTGIIKPEVGAKYVRDRESYDRLVRGEQGSGGQNPDNQQGFMGGNM